MTNNKKMFQLFRLNRFAKLSPLLLLIFILGICAAYQFKISAATFPKSSMQENKTVENAPSSDGEYVMAHPRRDDIVSLVRLIANPERYHKKRIRIEGYLLVIPDQPGIFLSKEDANHLIRNNGIAVSFDSTKISLKNAMVPYDFPINMYY